MNQIHGHPKPAQHRIFQIAIVLLITFMYFTAPVQIFVALTVPAPLLIITAIITLVLTIPLIRMLYTSPPISLHEDGIQMHPMIGKPQFIEWGEIDYMKEYPLLPQPDSEVIQRFIITGRKNYRPAEGMMLVIPSLSAPYRITGFFAGENRAPVIAITNRTHTGYHELIDELAEHVPVRKERDPQ